MALQPLPEEFLTKRYADQAGSITQNVGFASAAEPTSEMATTAPSGSVNAIKFVEVGEYGGQPTS
jgi:hypothetical protein